jgi:hypothetical protein
MRIVRFHNGRTSEVPETYAEGFEMLTASMNRFHDCRGGNLERASVAGRVAYGLFGAHFMAPDPTIALVFLLQEICKRKGAGLEGAPPASNREKKRESLTRPTAERGETIDDKQV